jgi:hypothetical protein
MLQRFLMRLTRLTLGIAVLNRQMQVVHPSPLALDRNLGQGENRENAVRIGTREFLSVCEGTYPKPLPGSGGSPCDMSLSHTAQRSYCKRMPIRN